MSTPINRRTFLGQTALGAAGVVATAQTASTQASPSDRVVIGIMGMKRGLQLATQFVAQPNVEIRYTCDVDSTRAETAANTIQSKGSKRPQAITDFRRILDDPEVDALICAAPNH